MKIKWKRGNVISSVIVGGLCLLLGSLPGCTNDEDLLPEKSQTASSLLDDSKAYFETLITQTMEIPEAELKTTLHPGEFTPLWDEAYISATDKYDYVNVPITSQYQFVVRKNVGTDEKPKTRHVVAEQIISFRRSKVTGAFESLYMTFVSTVWYYDRHQNNVVKSFFSSENHGEFSGYILYNEPIKYSLISMVKCDTGRTTNVMYRNISGSNEATAQLFSQFYGNDAFIKRSRFKTKSTDEDNDIINAGFYTGDIDIIGNYVPDCTYDHDPWGDDHLIWEGDETLAALEKLAGNIYFSGINKNYYTSCLANALNRLLESNRRFKLLIYDLFVSLNIRINFGLDPSSPYPAYYNPADKTIYFKDANAISEYKIPEEMFHALQDYFYSGGIQQYSIIGTPNIEMEAKIFLDVIRSTCCSFFGTNEMLSDRDWNTYIDYLELLEDIRARGSSTFTPETYNDWLTTFKQYNSAYNKPSSNDFSDTYLLNYLLQQN